MYLVGFRVVLMCMLNNYMEKEGFNKKVKIISNVMGDDVCEGLIVVVSVKVFDFKFLL